MDEVVKQIVERTGLPEAQARMAAEIAFNFIKSKLPEPLASQVEGVLAGQAAMDAVSKGLEGFGDLFGGK
jgi:hypothetical protein